MGREISFYCGVRTLGTVHFSSATMGQQNRVYGLDYADCLSYDTPQGEMFGPPDSDEHEGPYSPDWDRSLARAKKLLALVEATDNEGRKQYDLPKIRELVTLLEQCATSPLREYCRVRIFG
jgi:hypothetical protein